MPPFTIRRFRPDDQAAIESLEASVQPYRPEDQPEVDAMHVRASAAKASDSGWFAHKPEPDDIGDIARWYPGFWVAVIGDHVVGMVGVRREFAPGVTPARDTWRQRDDVGELRRLRVAHEARRRGIGAALTRAVIDWSREDGCRTLFLHTTSAQAPARALYESLGFRDIGHIFTGEWEYVWYAMDLTADS
jgi:ribosomal protein S18 acetylase RimI-like enzyme